jgi:glycosyltransferase involved in cell wall biosynthesis
MRSVLSYFSDYFQPDSIARLSNHSTGQIAAHLYAALGEYGQVSYYGEDPVNGLTADLFVGHFWSFAEYCRRNSFTRKVVVYPVADPSWTWERLQPLAEEFDVPMPLWDLPPPDFDYEYTMELADLVLVVGNQTTLATFPERWQHKIRLLNYSVDPRVLLPEPAIRPRAEFCYVATWCDLRKGFMDVLQTWSGDGLPISRVHVIGGLKRPWAERMNDVINDHIVYHGWLDSHSVAYRSAIRGCRYAHIPTYSEGQMGTLLEVMAQGCIPVTTAISGVDEEVLSHCFLVPARDIQAQREAISEAMSWPEAEYQVRREALLEVVERKHNWTRFGASVTAALMELP